MEWSASAGLAMSCVSAAAATMPGGPLFDAPRLWPVKLTLEARDLQSLRQDPRRPVPVQVAIGDTTVKAALHLKGSTGSFQPVDGKPSFTLDFARFDPGRRLHGLSKIHLNNSVEDATYLHEWIGAALFSSAGVPAPRVTHARVELNQRKLGVYVIKEGFTREFLQAHFGDASGNLYDTGPGHDVDQRLQKDLGASPDDQSDLAALAEAAHLSDLEARWQRMQRVLHTERFLSFMAMEVVAGHRDGYCLARNNFRIYHDPQTDRLVFLPHGMDQLFGKADASWRPTMAGLVARAWVETPEGRRRYRERVTALTSNVLEAPRLQEKIDGVVRALRRDLTSKEAAAWVAQAAGLKERIAQRKAALLRQLAQAELTQVVFTNGLAPVTGWRAVDPPPAGALEKSIAPDRRAALLIRASGLTAASWRSRQLLARGAYRFEARVMTRGVAALDFGRNRGAGLRVSGRSSSAPQQLIGDNDWRPLAVSFRVESGEEEVELVCELRARSGEAWFEVESLRLVKTE